MGDVPTVIEERIMVVLAICMALALLSLTAFIVWIIATGQPLS